MRLLKLRVIDDIYYVLLASSKFLALLREGSWSSLKE